MDRLARIQTLPLPYYEDQTLFFTFDSDRLAFFYQKIALALPWKYNQYPSMNKDGLPGDTRLGEKTSKQNKELII